MSHRSRKPPRLLLTFGKQDLQRQLVTETRTAACLICERFSDTVVSRAKLESQLPRVLLLKTAKMVMRARRDAAARSQARISQPHLLIMTWSSILCLGCGTFSLKRGQAMRNHDSKTIDKIHRCCWHDMKLEQGSEAAGYSSSCSTLYVIVCDPTRRSRFSIAHEWRGDIPIATADR